MVLSYTIVQHFLNLTEKYIRMKTIYYLWRILLVRAKSSWVLVTWTPGFTSDSFCFTACQTDGISQSMKNESREIPDFQRDSTAFKAMLNSV